MYESFYGLNAKPFRLTPDPRFLFVSTSHKKALSYLRYGVYRAEGFVVVVGAPGTGKTTLVKTVISELPASEIVVAKLVTTQLGADDVLRSLAAELGLEYEGHTKAGILNNIEKFLKEQSRNDKRVLLLVDEAQHLSRDALEELRMLTNFQEGENALMQCFLIGQEELKAFVDSPSMEQLRQRVIACCHLKPLSGSETVAYIEHRLHQAGWNGEAIFSFGAYELIHRQTKGNPRLINGLCERVLLHGYLEGLREIDENTALTVIEEVVGEAGSQDILDELHQTKEAIREVRRSLKVVKNNGSLTEVDEGTQELDDSFRFHTITEPESADAGLGSGRENPVSKQAPTMPESRVASRAETVAPIASSHSDVPVKKGAAVKPPVQNSVAPKPETSAHEPHSQERDAHEPHAHESHGSYVEAVANTITKQSSASKIGQASPVPVPVPDPTPYFGAQKANAPIPKVDSAYQPPASKPSIQHKVVKPEPTWMDKLKKQLPNIGIGVVLLGLMMLVFFPEPELPLEIQSAVENQPAVGVEQQLPADAEKKETAD